MELLALKIITLVFSIYFSLVESIPLTKQYRSTIPEWTEYNSFQPEGPGTYAFGYDIEDPDMDNIQFRDEERHPNGTVRGSYGYLRPDGMVHIVHYTADASGYRATIETYPRGQLKPFSGTNTVKEESVSTPADLQSERQYKKQRVHEQRQRPIDTQPLRKAVVPYFFADNTRDVYDRKSAQYLQPPRLFIKN